jgi:hypothetical protein
VVVLPILYDVSVKASVASYPWVVDVAVVVGKVDRTPIAVPPAMRVGVPVG